jgi:hypothetical protein
VIRLGVICAVAAGTLAVLNPSLLVPAVVAMGAVLIVVFLLRRSSDRAPRVDVEHAHVISAVVLVVGIWWALTAPSLLLASAVVLVLLLGLLIARRLQNVEIAGCSIPTPGPVVPAWLIFVLIGSVAARWLLQEGPSTLYPPPPPEYVASAPYLGEVRCCGNGSIVLDEAYTLDAAALDKLVARVDDGDPGSSPETKAEQVASTLEDWSLDALGLDGSATFTRTSTVPAPSGLWSSTVELPVSTMYARGSFWVTPASASPISVFAPRNTVLQTFPESSGRVATLAGDEERIDLAADRLKLLVRLRLAPEWARNDLLAPAMTFSLTDQAHWLIVAIAGVFAAALSRRLVPPVDRAIDRVVARVRSAARRV